MNDKMPGRDAAPRYVAPAEFEALQKETLSMEVDPILERIALLLVVNCFRNTVIEDYHSEWPEFDDGRMKALMKEAVDKVHTALHAICAGDAETREAALEVLNWYYPHEWDRPEFDQGLLRAVELTKRSRRTGRSFGRTFCCFGIPESRSARARQESGQGYGEEDRDCVHAHSA